MGLKPCLPEFLAFIIKMPSRCVAAWCDHKDNQLYQWPKDASLARLWTNFVKTKRDKWTPSARSVLCSKHFKDYCFQNMGQYRAGLSKRYVKINVNLYTYVYRWCWVLDFNNYRYKLGCFPFVSEFIFFSIHFFSIHFTFVITVVGHF